MKKATTTMTKATSGAKQEKAGDSPSRLIDARITALGDWRGAMLARVRKIIREADPGVVEAVKWRKPSNAMLGVPVWERDGIICTGETYKTYVKLTFARVRTQLSHQTTVAAISAPARKFLASLS